MLQKRKKKILNKPKKSQSKQNSLINELLLNNSEMLNDLKQKSQTPSKILAGSSTTKQKKKAKPQTISKTTKHSKNHSSIDYNLKKLPHSNGSKKKDKNFHEMNTSPLVRNSKRLHPKEKKIKKKEASNTIPLTKSFQKQNSASALQSSTILSKKRNKKMQKSSSVPNLIPKKKVNKTIYKIESLSQVGFSGPGVKKFNQDNYFIYKNLNDEENTLYLGVCDGHGVVGHDVSKYIITHLPSKLNTELKKTNKYINNKENLYKTFTNVFLETNKQLCNSYTIDTRFSGSTCVTIILTKNKVISANIGDSRAVLARYQNGKWTAIDLSRDHKPNDKDEKERILAKGGRIESYKDENGEDFGPPRIWLQNEDIPGLAMSRSFGDEVAASVGAISEPEMKSFELCDDDKFIIIASDGIWEFISSQECVEMIKDFYLKKDLTNCLKYLLNESSKRWIKEEGVIDDITAIIVFFNED